MRGLVTAGVFYLFQNEYLRLHARRIGPSGSSDVWQVNPKIEVKFPYALRERKAFAEKDLKRYI